MPGAVNLRDSTALKTLLLRQSAANKYVAAICASPAVILAHHGLVGDRRATCYPAPKFTAAISNYSTNPVEVDGTLITSQGPGTSLQFSLQLVELLFGAEKAAQLRQEMIG